MSETADLSNVMDMVPHLILNRSYSSTTTKTSKQIGARKM